MRDGVRDYLDRLRASLWFDPMWYVVIIILG
jgi:hypothetical protein